LNLTIGLLIFNICALNVLGENRLSVDHYLKILDGIEQQCHDQAFIQTSLGL
jgi:hypothetical protein